jgi:4-amino-4-deoxy-L-arabinose transferase-like glycosyltransferase
MFDTHGPIRTDALRGRARMTVTRTPKLLLRLDAALSAPATADRTAAVLLALWIALYAAFASISTRQTGVHWDIGELVAWSRQPAWGYKHPPMSAWIAALWFAVFPVADWSAFLLAMVVSGSAIWIAWRICRACLPPDRWPLALAMLFLIPLYSFQAAKFNANTVMMPFWALATLGFLRSVERRSLGASASAGLAGAGAMLGKYWSVNLVAGLGLAALLDRRRAAYFRSAAPWVLVAVCALALAPHVIWLRTDGAVASGFATSIAASSNGAARTRSVEYVLGSLAYLAVPLLLYAALRPARAALRDTLWPADATRRLMVLAMLLPFLLPAVLNLVVPTRLTSLWTIPNWTLVPAVLLGSPLLTVTRRVRTAAVGLALAIPVLALIAAPFVATASHASGRNVEQAQAPQLGTAVQQRWAAATSAPLRWIGGETDVSYNAAFYANDKPRVRTEGAVDSAFSTAVRRDGMAVVCRVETAPCVVFLDAVQRAMGGIRAETTLVHTYRGVAGPARRYRLLLTPPAQ